MGMKPRKQPEPRPGGREPCGCWYPGLRDDGDVIECQRCEAAWRYVGGEIVWVRQRGQPDSTAAEEGDRDAR